MIGIRRLLRKDRQFSRDEMNVAELASIAAALKSAKIEASNCRIGKMADALALSLQQQERLIAGAPEFIGKGEVMRFTAVARALIEKIVAELQSQSADQFKV